MYSSFRNRRKMKAKESETFRGVLDSRTEGKFDRSPLNSIAVPPVSRHFYRILVTMSIFVVCIVFILSPSMSIWVHIVTRRQWKQAFEGYSRAREGDQDDGIDRMWLQRRNGRDDSEKRENILD